MRTIKQTALKFIALISLASPWQLTAQQAELKIGDIAPAFSLHDQDNKLHTLDHYQKKWLVIYFYPKDDTPGCTQQACNFRDDIVQIRQLKAEVIGISIDDIDSHKHFADKYSLPFPLLADPDGLTAKEYDAFFSLGPLKFARRHSFIISPDSKIAKIYRQVDTQSHSKDIINALNQLINKDQ
ncbi:MAG: peroxiredoxin [Gammaproteobacteria bacterium]|nr:peroxiredoxin [Gammaproteobacteria bacterium]